MKPARAKSPADPQPGAIDLLEESIARLRQAPAAAFAQYYGATLPFVLAALYFWADFSRSADAAGRVHEAAFVLTLLFLLMKTGHAAFADGLLASAAGKPTAPWTGRRLARTAFVQAVIQPTGLFLLPAAAIATLPLGWVYAFYQNVTALGAGGDGSTLEIVSRASNAALRRPKQNHVALAIVSGMGFFVWLNILIAVLLLPQLARQFTGEENMFTRSGVHLFNTTFFAVTWALVYLAVDPLLKTFYALRCFHAESAVSGADLKAALRSLGPVRAAAVALMLLGCGALPATAAEEKPVAPAEIQRSAREVLQRPEFAWRMPAGRLAPVEEEPGMFANWRKWFRAKWQAFLKWLSEYFKDRRSSESAPRGDIGGLLRIIGWTGLGLVTIAVLWLLWRSRFRRPPVEGQALALGAAIDLADESVQADQLPEDEWLALANQHLERGELRLAARAFHLSGIAGLAARGLVSMARFKSNRDYLIEVERRGRGLGDLPGAFARNVRRFERVWYGTHAATEELLTRLREDRALMTDAAPPVPPPLLP